MAERPLRDLLADLVGDAEARHAYGQDPAAYLAAHGHDLPGPLVAEAVVSYADTAPVEVAEALAPYVMANGPIPASDPAPDWFDLLTSVEPAAEEVPETEDWPDPGDLDFGAGSGAVPDPVAPPPEPTDELAEPPAETSPRAADPEPEWADSTFTPEPPIEGLEPEDDDPLE